MHLQQVDCFNTQIRKRTVYKLFDWIVLVTSWIISAPNPTPKLCRNVYIFLCIVNYFSYEASTRPSP